MKEKTYKEHLEDMLSDKECSDEMTGYQHQAVDAMIELLSVCSYEELCEFAKAKIDGRMTILPCKPGDNVWVIIRRGTSYRVELWIVYKIYEKNDGSWFFVLKSIRLSKIKPNEFEEITRAISSFGKTVFASREPAEEKLKELIDNGKTL